MITEQNKRTQQRKVYELLCSPNPDGFTRMQIALCLGIERASVCRRVAELRDMGKIWIVKKGIDPTTKERASFVTSNPEVAERARAQMMLASQREEVELTGKLF